MIAPGPLNRKLAILFCLCLIYFFCPAQDKAKNTWGKISSADFNEPIKSSFIDSGASAIILSDLGTIHFVGNNKGWFSHVYKRQTRIKILNKKAFDLASVNIVYFASGDDPEKLTDVDASAYNLENGQVVRTRLDSKDIFDDRLDKEYSQKKFSIPGVKEGSIIEYTYTITSDYSLPSWKFQWVDHPCLFSELQVEIPQTLYYVFVRQGVHSFAVDKGSQGNTSYRVSRKRDAGGLATIDDAMVVSAITVKHDWAMKDVPAFGQERFLTTPANYIDKIDFQLAKTYNGEDFHDVSNTWANATSALLHRPDFGQPLEDDNSWMDASIDKIVAGTTSGLEQARAIYYYVSRHITCTDHHDPYIKTDLHDVIKKNNGTVGDVNLLLVAMLRRRGLSAEPVLLSTRESGFNLASYPILQRLNYVVVRLMIEGKVYYLDAAHPQLGFGQLAGNCYNGHARVISNKDSSSVWFWADSLKESKVTMVMISNTDKGIEGTWQSTLGKQESYQLRSEIAEHGREGYFKKIQTAYGDECEISNGNIDSLERPEDPAKVYYDFSIKPAAGATLLYFNPVMGDGWRENPFKAIDRKYPVEMPYAIDETYLFLMDIPVGYAVDELPKSAKVAFNADQGYFEYLVAQSGEQIQLRCKVRLNKATFAPEDYGPLRDFFGFIVKKENEQIVLKKK